jgi:hypothetical protein
MLSTRCLSSAGISTWPWKPKNLATFQAHWESIEATCLGASIARKMVESRPLGTSWTRSRSSSLARSAWATCGQFCYIDGEVRKPSGSDTYLLRCRDLFARLDSFRVVYVAADQSMFAMAGSIFCPGARGRAEDRTACPSIRKSGDYWIMFYDRDLLEGRQTASFGKRQPDQLSDELRGSGGRSTRFCSAIGSNRARGCSQRKGPRRTTVLARSQPNC